MARGPRAGSGPGSGAKVAAAGPRPRCGDGCREAPGLRSHRRRRRPLHGNERDDRPDDGQAYRRGKGPSPAPGGAAPIQPRAGGRSRCALAGGALPHLRHRSPNHLPFTSGATRRWTLRAGPSQSAGSFSGRPTAHRPLTGAGQAERLHTGRSPAGLSRTGCSWTCDRVDFCLKALACRRRGRARWPPAPPHLAPGPARPAEGGAEASGSRALAVGADGGGWRRRFRRPTSRRAVSGGAGRQARSRAGSAAGACAAQG